MNELSGYIFSSLREGDIALYRGSGNGLTPILLVAAEGTSAGCVERLEHEYALKSELDADWAARPVALTHDNGRMCPSADDLRLIRRFEKGGSGSSGLEFKRPAADAASGGLRWLYA